MRIMIKEYGKNYENSLYGMHLGKESTWLVHTYLAVDFTLRIFILSL
jgi:hypothetical protein